MDEIFEVVGIRTMNFIGRDGRPVQKMRWFVTFNVKGVEGVCTDQVTLNTADALKLDWLPQLGDLYRCVYNKYGRVVAFEPVE